MTEQSLPGPDVSPLTTDSTVSSVGSGRSAGLAGDESDGGRALVAGYGSAGDLFPLIPVALQLQDEGHDVRFAAPRALTLYLRTLGFSCIGLGDGREMQVLGDDRLVTTRFDGWESWFRVVDSYVAGSLERDVASLEKVVATWRPNLVVTSSFATAARVVARRHGFPHVPVSIYPQMQARLGDGKGFARRYSGLCAGLADLEGPAGDARSNCSPAGLPWGVGPGTVLLHDPALLTAADPPSGGGTGLLGMHAGCLSAGMVGFPYWDGGVEEPADVARVEDWFEQAGGPVAVVTMGSFLGVSRSDELARLAREVMSAGARVLAIGPGAAGLDVDEAPLGAVLGTGFVRLSRVASRAAVVVHHGGIGSTFGTLRAGAPAVVVPRAFDQPFNARLVEAMGVGLDADPSEPGGVGAAVRRVLDDSGLRQQAEDVGGQLIPTEQSVQTLVGMILAAAQDSPDWASPPGRADRPSTGAGEHARLAGGAER